MSQSKKAINEAEVEGFVRNGSSIQEIADYLGVKAGRIERHFARQIARARALRQMHLRKHQWKAAQEGGVQMLILLGKHELGQGQEKPASEEKVILRRYIGPGRTRTPGSGRA